MCEFLDLVLVECICKVAAPAEVTPLVVISESELICTIIRKLIERKDCKERGITLLLRALSTDFGLRFCVNVRFCNILLTLCHKMI